MVDSASNRYKTIQSLRALAVIAVCVHHLIPDVFTLGYLGVDLFFVLSGFVITKLLLVSFNKASVLKSLFNFSLGRANRLLPSLLILYPFVFLVNIGLQNPDDQIFFIKSLLYSLLFLSNVYYSSSMPYFSPDAKEMPLLHTWSLSVEEQFYLVYPLIILFVLFRRKIGVLAIAFICISSFVWYLTGRAGFYSIGMRAWELLSGALVLFIATKVRALPSSRIISFFFIVAWFFLLSILFLGFENVIVCRVAVVFLTCVLLFIIYFDDNWSVINNPAAMAIGSASYVIYLFHLPIFVFMYRLAFLESTTQKIYASIFVAIVSFVVYRFYEVRVRKLVASRKRVTYFFIGVYVSFIVFVASISDISRLGHLQRSLLPESLYQTLYSGRDIPYDYKCVFQFNFSDDSSASRFAKCSERGKATLLLGDSHGVDLYRALARQNPEQLFVVSFAHGGCRPYDMVPECEYDKIASFIDKNSVNVGKIVYYQSPDTLYTRGSQLASDDVAYDYDNISKLRHYLDYFSQQFPILFVLPSIMPYHSQQRSILNAFLCLQPTKFSWVNERNRNVYGLRDILRERFSDMKSVSVVALDSYLNYRPTDLYECNVVFWRNGDHWSYKGESRFGERLLELFDQ